MPPLPAFQVPFALPFSARQAPNRTKLCRPIRLSAATPESAKPNLHPESNHTIPSSPPPPSLPITPNPVEYTLAPNEIGVRFINGPSGSDVIAAAFPGDPLLRVGDTVGLSIPRGCQSGLCGLCTCDIVDPVTGEIETVRACQTGVYVAAEGAEMVIDVERMREVRTGKRKDPMARFENLDTEYVAGAAPRVAGWTEMVTCLNCEGSGDVECLACDGTGHVDNMECMLCAGTGVVRCAECQGKGVVMVKR